MIQLNLSRRERYIFIVTVIIVVSALSYNFIFEPLVKRWISLNNEIIIKHSRLTRDVRLLENQYAIIKDYKVYAQPPENISEILSHIEKQADLLGIETSDIKPWPVVTKELYKESSIELRIEGTFSVLNKFISHLIKPPAVIAIKKFDLTSARETPSRFKGTLVLSKLII